MTFLILAGSYPFYYSKRTDQLLDILLDGEWTCHFADVLDLPIPQVTGFSADAVATLDRVHLSYSSYDLFGDYNVFNL